MIIPMIDGNKIPFVPFLEIPNKATMLEIIPMAISNSANCTTNGVIFRGTICPQNMKSEKMMRLMTGHTQPSFAARHENDVDSVFIFEYGLTPEKLSHPETNGSANLINRCITQTVQ